MQYNPFEKTALRRKEFSRPMRELFKRDLLTGKVLDFACGYGFDVKKLSELGLDIVGYDRYNVVFSDTQMLHKRYDVVTCNYMFNVIPDLEEHSKMIELLRSLSDNVYIAVRTDTKAIKSTWKWDRESWGYWTPRGSFQRFYDDYGEIQEWFGDVEYIIDDYSMKLFKLKEN